MKSAYPRPEDQVRRDVQKMATHFESEEPDVSCPLPGGVEHFPSDRSKEDAITTHPTLTPNPPASSVLFNNEGGPENGGDGEIGRIGASPMTNRRRFYGAFLLALSLCVCTVGTIVIVWPRVGGSDEPSGAQSSSGSCDDAKPRMREKGDPLPDPTLAPVVGPEGPLLYQPGELTTQKEGLLLST